jgi:GntR family transcriptional regulator
MAIDRHSPIPIYYQLAELIRDQVRQGELQPGDQLSAERILADRYAISRMTVRQAITYLVREGVVVARHGLGTFVAAPKLTHDALHLLGFTEEMMRQGGTAASQVLEQARITPPSRIGASLQLQAGAEVVRIVRLRLAGQAPLLLETSCVAAALCPGLEDEDLTRQSLYSVLEQRYGLQPRRARQSLEATVANAYEAALFDIAPGTAMFLLEGIAYDSHERAIEHFKAIYRGDRFKFTFASERGARPAGASTPQLSIVLEA